MSVASRCCKSFCVVPCVIFYTGHFVMVPLNMTYLHRLQHSLFEHLFNLYYIGVTNIDIVKHCLSHEHDLYWAVPSQFIFYCFGPTAILLSKCWRRTSRYVFDFNA